MNQHENAGIQPESKIEATFSHAETFDYIDPLGLPFPKHVLGQISYDRK